MMGQRSWPSSYQLVSHYAYLEHISSQAKGATAASAVSVDVWVLDARQVFLRPRPLAMGGHPHRWGCSDRGGLDRRIPSGWVVRRAGRHTDAGWRRLRLGSARRPERRPD